MEETTKQMISDHEEKYQLENTTKFICELSSYLLISCVTIFVIL